MDFRELNYVLAIAKHQNITKAAESLYLTQPTLSKFLIQLEKELGQPLFRKLGHKYLLTYAGERYIQTAQEILHLKNDLDHELADILKRDVGVLNVAFARMRCTYLLPGILPAFQKKYPNVKINLFEGDSDENDQRLLEGKAEIVFYSKPQNLNAFIEYDSLIQEELLLCTKKNHPLSKFAKHYPDNRYPLLDPKLFEQELLIQLMPEQRTRQITDYLFKDMGWNFQNKMSTSSLPAIMELVCSGYGFSFIFESHLRYHKFSEPIDCFSIQQPPLVSDFVVAHRKGAYLSSYTLEFIEIARKFLLSEQSLAKTK